MLGAAPAGAPPSVRIERLSPGAVQPQVAVDGHGGLHRIFLQGDPAAADVFYQRRKPSDSNGWSQPVRVNTEPGSAIAIGTIRGPSIAVGGTNWIHVLWNGSSKSRWKSTNGSPLLYSRAPISAATFSEELPVARSTRHLDGGGAIAADGEGRVFAFWHASGPTVPDGEQHRRVFVSASEDNGAHFTAERAISPENLGACGCCGLAAGIGASHELYVVFRSATPDGSRDTALLTSRDGGVRFDTSILDRWKASQCPMSLPSMDLSAGATTFLWETGPNIFWTDASALSQPRTLPANVEGKGRRKHPVSVRTREGYSLLAWSEGTGWQKGGYVGWQLRRPEGTILATERSPSMDLPVWSRPAVYFDAMANTFVLVY